MCARYADVRETECSLSRSDKMAHFIAREYNLIIFAAHMRMADYTMPAVAVMV